MSTTDEPFDRVRVDAVSFTSHAGRCAGRLFTPRTGRSRSCIVMGHGFGGVVAPGCLHWPSGSLRRVMLSWPSTTGTTA